MAPTVINALTLSAARASLASPSPSTFHDPSPSAALASQPPEVFQIITKQDLDVYNTQHVYNNYILTS